MQSELHARGDSLDYKKAKHFQPRIELTWTEHNGTKQDMSRWHVLSWKLHIVCLLSNIFGNLPYPERLPLRNLHLEPDPQKGVPLSILRGAARLPSFSITAMETNTSKVVFQTSPFHVCKKCFGWICVFAQGTLFDPLVDMAKQNPGPGLPKNRCPTCSQAPSASRGSPRRGSSPGVKPPRPFWDFLEGETHRACPFKLTRKVFTDFRETRYKRFSLG